MTSVPATPRKLTLAEMKLSLCAVAHNGSRPPVHSSSDGFIPDLPYGFSPDSSSSPNKNQLRAFQESYSALKSIQRCGLNRRSCDGALCARCSSKRSRRHRRELQRALSASPPAYAMMWTATVASTPDRALAALWDDLDGLIQHMASGAWLSRRVDGYVRSIEVERTPNGWHPHAHTLLVFRNELTRPEATKLAQDIQRRYLRAADLRRIPASAKGQHVVVVPLTDLSTIVGYITKQHMTTGPSRTPGTLTPSMLLRSSFAGDADALELLNELELAYYRRRTWQRGGDLLETSHETATAPVTPTDVADDIEHPIATLEPPEARGAPAWWGGWSRPEVTPARRNYGRKIYPGERLPW